ncbi:ALPHA-MANNOSIDASE domain protein, partial [Mycobacterium xenopi 4042]
RGARRAGRPGLAPSPQTRDMNPIYTGRTCRSSTPNRQPGRRNHGPRRREVRRVRRAVGRADYRRPRWPRRGCSCLRRPPRRHHRSESDQVYLDLLTGWRDAWNSAGSTRQLAGAAVTGGQRRCRSVEFLAHKRTNVVTVRLDTPGRVFDADGDEMPRWSSRRTLGDVSGSRRALARVRAYRVLPCEVLSGWKPLRAT